MKIWTSRSSPPSGSRNAWTRIKNVNFWGDSNDFLSRLVTTDETWLYHYDPKTKQQSIEWRHAAQIIPCAKIRWKIFRLDFFLSRRHPPHLLYSKGPNYQREVLLISAGAIEGYFEGKTPREVHHGSRSCTTMPRLTGHLQPRINWPTWASSLLITHPYLRIWHRRTTTYFLDWKNNWKFAVFLPTRRPLLPRRPGWKNKILNLFEWLAVVWTTV